MSETPPEESTPEPETTKPVKLTKGSPLRGPAKEKLALLPLPNTVKLGMAGLVVAAVGVLLHAFAIRAASTATLRKMLIHINATAKKPKKNYGVIGDQQIVKDLHSLKSAYVPLAVLTVFIVAFLIFGLRRPRSASGSRWVMIVAMIFPTGVLFGFYSLYGSPPAAKFGGYLMTIGAASAIILMFVPASSAYFKASRDAALPPHLRGQPRPKLFGARTAPAARPAGARPTARPSTPSNTATGGSKAKSKARSDAEAVARGAELARSRARSSKSRRTDV